MTQLGDIAAISFPERLDLPRISVAGMSLRHARSQDVPFLLELYRSFRADEMAPVPWPPEQKNAFLEQQFLLQHRHYGAVFPEADFLIVEFEGKPIGRVYLDWKRQQWLIVDIGLLPDWRRQGKGTALLSAMQSEARTSGASGLILHVEQRNFRAQSLYTRLGFRVTNDAGSHIQMEWNA